VSGAGGARDGGATRGGGRRAAGGTTTVDAAPPAGGGSGSALSILDLSVRFGGVVAVDGVDLEVAPGEIVGLVGPNGAGKTTLLDAVCGLVPARGRVVVGGRDVSRLAPPERARAGIGRSFQDARLFPSLTVGEAVRVAFERHLRREGVVAAAVAAPWVTHQERDLADRAEELVSRMGLDGYRDKFVSELSTGTRRIVDLAMVLAHGPSVLLLDEPSSGIAQRESEALGPVLRRVRDETGCAMLVVEHDIPLVRSLADELVALDAGRVLARGAPDAVLSDPRLVEAYLGTNQAVIARSGAAADGRRPRPLRARPADAPADGRRAAGTGAARPLRARPRPSPSIGASPRPLRARHDGTPGQGRTRRT
jgi:ABC-type branched-subunit amino acid transport system ATPase component